MPGKDALNRPLPSTAKFAAHDYWNQIYTTHDTWGNADARVKDMRAARPDLAADWFGVEAI